MGMICPRCGWNLLKDKNEENRYKCPVCGWIHENKKPDPDNPYTEFAKEMSLLHEALKAEGFKDAMIDILAKMAPILWDRCAHLEYVKENEAKKNRDLFIVPGEEPIKFGIRVGAYSSGKEKENEGNR